MAEEIIIKTSDAKPKSSRLKSIESGGKSNPKTQYPSTTAGGKSKNTSDLKTTHRENIRSQDLTFFRNGGGVNQIIFRFRHAENAITRQVMKFDQSLRFFRCLEKNWKPAVDQPKHRKSLSEKFSDQTKEENQANPNKRRVLNFFGILGNCCSCNNWRLPGEP